MHMCTHIHTGPDSEGCLVTLPLASFSALTNDESPSVPSPITVGMTRLRPSSPFAKQPNSGCSGRSLPWSGAHKSSLNPPSSGRAWDSQGQLLKATWTLVGHPGKELPLFPAEPHLFPAITRVQCSWVQFSFSLLFPNSRS